MLIIREQRNHIFIEETETERKLTDKELKEKAVAHLENLKNSKTYFINKRLNLKIGIVNITKSEFDKKVRVSTKKIINSKEEESSVIRAKCIAVLKGLPYFLMDSDPVHMDASDKIHYRTDPITKQKIPVVRTNILSDEFKYYCTISGIRYKIKIRTLKVISKYKGKLVNPGEGHLLYLSFDNLELIEI